MSSDLSGEITAIATAILAAFAIVTATLAYMAFRRQTQEVAILQQQMKEQQDVLAREARERHRAQAARVFISLNYRDEQSASFTVANTSEQPVYDAEIQWRQSRSRPRIIRHSPLGTILPGDRRIIVCEPTQGDPGTLPDPDDHFTTLIFLDAAGVMWTRRLDGDLSELGTLIHDDQTPKQE